MPALAEPRLRGDSSAQCSKAVAMPDLNLTEQAQEPKGICLALLEVFFALERCTEVSELSDKLDSTDTVARPASQGCAAGARASRKGVKRRAKLVADLEGK